MFQASGQYFRFQCFNDLREAKFPELAL